MRPGYLGRGSSEDPAQREVQGLQRPLERKRYLEVERIARECMHVVPKSRSGIASAGYLPRKVLK